MSHEIKIFLTVLGAIAAVLLVAYFGLALFFFFVALGNKKRPDMTVPAKNSLFERNADNPNLVAGY